MGWAMDQVSGEELCREHVGQEDKSSRNEWPRAEEQRKKNYLS
jgi:hypothetical protein